MTLSFGRSIFRICIRRPFSPRFLGGWALGKASITVRPKELAPLNYQLSSMVPEFPFEDRAKDLSVRHPPSTGLFDQPYLRPSRHRFRRARAWRAVSPQRMCSRRPSCQSNEMRDAAASRLPHLLLKWNSFAHSARIAEGKIPWLIPPLRRASPWVLTTRKFARRKPSPNGNQKRTAHESFAAGD